MEISDFSRVCLELPREDFLLSLDIDDTILYFKEIPSSYWDEGGGLKFFNSYIERNLPEPTDLIGLQRLLESAKNRVIFLTARPMQQNSLTRKHLDHLGLPNIPIYNSEGFHYGDKGKILLQVAQERKVNFVIAIDDSEKHLEKIRRAFEGSSIQLETYKFRRC